MPAGAPVDVLFAVSVMQTVITFELVLEDRDARHAWTGRDRGPGIRRAAAASEEEDEAETDDRRTHRGEVPAGARKNARSGALIR